MAFPDLTVDSTPWVHSRGVPNPMAVEQMRGPEPRKQTARRRLLPAVLLVGCSAAITVSIVLAAAALNGRSKDKAADMSACIVQADSFFGDLRAFDVESPRSQFIIGCMASKGYAFDIAPAACDSHRPLAAQSSCYSADDWLYWIITKFRAT
jgi:hypothetical protein